MNSDPFYPFEEQNIPNHPADTLTVRQFLEQDGRTLEQIAHAVMFGDELRCGSVSRQGPPQSKIALTVE